CVRQLAPLVMVDPFQSFLLAIVFSNAPQQGPGQLQPPLQLTYGGFADAADSDAAVQLRVEGRVRLAGDVDQVGDDAAIELTELPAPRERAGLAQGRQRRRQRRVAPRK